MRYLGVEAGESHRLLCHIPSLCVSRRVDGGGSFICRMSYSYCLLATTVAIIVLVSKPRVRRGPLGVP